MSHSQPFVFGIAARRFPKSGFGEQSSYLRGLLRIARRMGIQAFVYEPGQLERNLRTIRGWTYGNKGWVKRRCPLPDVVYDRVWGVSPSRKARHESNLDALQETGRIIYFNPPFTGKLRMHQTLSQNPDLKPHIPETLPLSAANVASLSEIHPILFIKPINGRQGKRISHCRKISKGWRIRQRTSGGGLRRLAAPTAADVVRRCRGKQPADYFLVQQGLDLIRCQGGSVDIRVIAQRNDEGVWSVTGMGARVGAPGSFVSNLHAGGRAYTLTRLCRHARLKTSPAKLRRRIETIVLKAVTHLTAEFPTLGEVGIDIGLDKKGRLWILEINRQPGRALFARAKLYTSWRRSRVRIVQFAKYLAKAGLLGHSPHRSSP